MSDVEQMAYNREIIVCWISIQYNVKTISHMLHEIHDSKINWKYVIVKTHSSCEQQMAMSIHVCVFFHDLLYMLWRLYIDFFF
jgi:hypothetical protein